MLRQSSRRPWRIAAAYQQLAASFSTASLETDEIIAYVRSQGKSDADQAIDILRAAAARQDGAHAGRLHLAMAEIAVERSQWDEATSHASAAATAALSERQTGAGEASLAQQVQLQSTDIGVRSLLVQGSDNEALALAAQGLRDAESSPQDSATLTEHWQHIIEARARLGIVQMAAGDRAGAAGAMKAVFSLINNKDAERGPVDDPNADLSTLPMMPKDVYIPGALQRYGAWAYTEGNLVQATRFLEKAAMAAEAARVQAEDSGQIPLLASTLPEVTLAAFAGHVQTELARARDQVTWRRTELHLESALERAEAISGYNHPRVIPFLIFLADVYAHTQRATLAEGLYRKAVKLLYRTPTPGLSSFILRQQPSPVHSSLETLLAWRFSQLLTALPKRGSEAAIWSRHAESTFDGPEGSLEDRHGPLDSLKGVSSPSAGVFVDVSLRRALPCYCSLADLADV